MTDKKDKPKKPDASKLSSARPTKIPRAAKTLEEVIEQDQVNWKRFAIGLGLVTVLLLIAYANTFAGDVVFNDRINFKYVSGAQIEPDFWLQLWCNSFVQPLSRGWVTASYAWDLASFQWNSGWSHVVNVTLHLVTCIYLYLLVFRLSWRFRNDRRLKADPYFVAFVITALFAVHPLTTGAVAYISGRMAPLMAANYFLSLNLFVAGFLCDSIALAMFFYVFSFVFTGIGLLCYAPAMTIPAAAVALALVLREPDGPWADRAQEVFVFALGALVIPCVIFLGFPKLIDNGFSLTALPAVSYVATQLKVFAIYYLRCFMLPFGLTVDPPYAVATSFADPLALLGLFCLLAFGGAIWLWRHKPLVVFGLVLCLLGLLPLSLMPQPEIVADQRFYLSLAGLCIAAGSGLGELAARFPRDIKRSFFILAAVLIVLTGLTIWRNLDWHNDISLWKQAIALNPSNARAHAMYADALFSGTKSADAAAEADRAIQLDANSAVAYAVRGKLKDGANDVAGAIENFQKAVDIARAQKVPGEQIGDYQKELAKNLFQSKQLGKAKEMAEDALKTLPQDASLHFILGSCLLAEKHYVTAFKELRFGFTRDPLNPDYLAPLAEAGLDSGIGSLTQNAYVCAKRICAIRNNEQNQLLFARAAVSVGKEKEGMGTLDHILQGNPHNAAALWVMGFAHQALGNDVEADKFKRAALQFDPAIDKKIVMHLAKRATPVALPGDTKGAAPTATTSTVPPIAPPKPTGVPATTVSPITPPKPTGVPSTTAPAPDKSTDSTPGKPQAEPAHQTVPAK